MIINVSHRGARLAVDELNRSGGLRGRRLRLLEYHTGSYFVDARHAAELAAREDGALAIVGSNSSSLSRAIAEVAEGERLVQVSNVSTATDLTWDPATGADRPFVFRACSSDEELTRHLADFARQHLGARRVAVLYEVGRSYSAQMARRFVSSFADLAAGRVAKELVYLPLETDFRPQLRAAQAFARSCCSWRVRSRTPRWSPRRREPWASTCRRARRSRCRTPTPTAKSWCIPARASPCRRA